MGISKRLPLLGGSGRVKPRQSTGTLALLALLGGAAYLVGQFGIRNEGTELVARMVEATSVMEDALTVIRRCRAETGIGMSPDDLNQTGLVGVRYSPITTTLGDLPAKRTTTNPNMAALMVRLLVEAGVSEGETVAIGASGSFPALIVATLAATEVLHLQPVLICSLGASQWGANEPEFTWLAMEDCLVESGVLSERCRTVAVSLGGDHDVGLDLDPDARGLLLKVIEDSGRPLIYEPVLEQNVRERIRIYDNAAPAGQVAAYVGIGGSWADLGENHAVLGLHPGLNVDVSVTSGSDNGVALEMAARGTPVIHLLNIRGLVQRYGLPWDPSPLPRPGEGGIYTVEGSGQWSSLRVAAWVYLAVVLVVAVGWRWLPWERHR